MCSSLVWLGRLRLGYCCDISSRVSSTSLLSAQRLELGGIILTEATLSYLAVGIPPPTPAWGAMVANGREYIGDAWWLSAIPGMAIFLVVMAGNFLGDWMRDRWDPNLRQLD